MTKGFLSINEVEVPVEFIDELYAFFRDNGKKGFESVALWAGEKQGTLFSVSHQIFPAQQLYKTPTGLSYSVNGEELDRINRWLYQNKKTIIAQIHSHPAEAYHSEVDDDFAIATTIGALSIVVPDFGFSDKHFSESAFFQLKENGWEQLVESKVETLLKFVK